MSLDRFIAELPAVADGDLMLCPEHGVAWQADRGHLVAYDEAYYDKCAGYEGKPIANAINAGRVALVNKYVGRNLVCDIGIGSGEFIKTRGDRTYGIDVNPVAIEWLKRNDLWGEPMERGFAGFTFWDVLEHLPEPESYLRRVPLKAFVFCSLPVFPALEAIRQSKHYRPGEHLYYWTEAGFLGWMDKHGFMMLERDDFETRAGRESIVSFAFKRNRNA